MKLWNIALNHSARDEAQHANQREQPTGGLCERVCGTWQVHSEQRFPGSGNECPFMRMAPL